MFDSYNVRAVSERVTENVNVTEKRAPTDESVKLLREMEAAAQAAIIATIRVTDTPVECVVRAMHADYMTVLRFRIVYSLGGVKRTVDYDHDTLREQATDYKAAIATALRDALARDIARLLVGQQLHKALRDVWLE